MSASNEMLNIKKELLKKWYEVILPRNTKEYANKLLTGETAHESTQNKINHDLLRANFETAKWADIMLIVNIKKNNIQNYIWGNSFLEMGFAHILHKPIFLLNEIPEISYKDEILAMQPKIIYGDLNKINII